MSFDSGAMIAEFRIACGPLNINDVPLREIEALLTKAAVELSPRLRFVIREDAQALALEAGRASYVLPANVDLILAASWNNTTLRPYAVRAWDRDLDNWRNTLADTAVNPSEYAVEARMLILKSAPSEDAVATDGYLKYRYVACPDNYDLSNGAFFGDSERWLLVHHASIDYLTRNATEANASRLVAATRSYAAMLPDAIQRATNRFVAWEPAITFARFRAGAAR